MDLTDHVAIISGGAKGQGAEEARRFVAAGGQVVVGDVAVDEGVELARTIGGAAQFVELDVCDEAAWATAVNAALERFGRIDTLINNAGIFRWRPIADETVEGFTSLLSVNVLGAFLGVKAVTSSMAEGGGGSIVNIGSIAAVRPEANQAAYVSSKWALRGFSRVAALELAPHRIRVNTVLPGPIDTDMYRDAVQSATPVSHGGRSREATTTTLVGRLGRPADVATLALFLASDLSSFITGAEFVVDGGRTLIV